ncbi:MAG TPA: MFS transporter, partial [Magnetospirillum sp.]|nr:MFS transporter [Magnetospirillum sp.]
VVDSLGAMLVLRFLQGLCMPAIFTVTMAYVGEEWSPSEVPEVVSLYTGGTALGGVSGRLVTAVAADALGWRDAFVVLGVVNLAAGLLIWSLLPAAKNFHATSSLRATLQAGLAHLRNPRLVATFGIGFTILFSLVSTFTYGTFYLAAAPFSLSITGQGMIFLVYLLGTVAAPVGGRMIARVGPVCGLAAAVAAVCVGQGLTLVPVLPVVVVGLAVLVCGIFICQTASISMISATAKASRSAAMGMYVTLYYVGGSLGAVVPAPAWHAVGWPGCVAIVVTVALCGLGLAARFWTAPRHQGA